MFGPAAQEPTNLSVLPRDDLRLAVGYLAIGGPPDSLIGQFNENDAVLFQARWSF